MQKQEDGKRHPIGYYSATLNEAQRNYDIYELELLAITECLKHWRPYLAGSPHEIIVHTDHANLTYWCQPQKICGCIARQVLELEGYNIKLQHVPGKNNRRADALSRRPDYCHEPRYWSAMDQYKATLSQGKQAQDVSLWFPYRLRTGRTVGNSHGHSFVQTPECGNKFNQAWESCTTTG